MRTRFHRARSTSSAPESHKIGRFHRVCSHLIAPHTRRTAVQREQALRDGAFGAAINAAEHSPLGLAEHERHEAGDIRRRGAAPEAAARRVCVRCAGPAHAAVRGPAAGRAGFDRQARAAAVEAVAAVTADAADAADAAPRGGRGGEAARGQGQGEEEEEEEEEVQARAGVREIVCDGQVRYARGGGAGVCGGAGDV